MQMEVVKDEVEKVEMPDILVHLIRQLNGEVSDEAARLQIEESGKEIAALQGFCAGATGFRQATYEGFVYPDEARGQEDNPIEIDATSMACSLPTDELRNVCSDIDELKDTEAWKRVTDNIGAQIDAKKEWLFDQAEKGRDLYWVKGWKNGLQWVLWQINHFHQCLTIREAKEEKAAKDKAERLPFE